jgi:hypothetical protein
MNQNSWRCVSASVRGTSHKTSGSECQDRNACVETTSEDGPVLIALVSDGAGSAKRSGDGAGMICETIREQSQQFFSDQGTLDQINIRLIANWVEMFRNEIILLADSDGVADREFACTLLGAIIGKSRAAFFQIGDGAIVYSLMQGGPYSLVFWPERGEYENTTYFATESTFFEQLQFTLVEGNVAELALLSDGLQRLALDYSKKDAHQPFFRGFFPSVQLAAEAEVTQLTEQLAVYLDSARVNQRTDDDKTLLLAVAPLSASQSKVGDGDASR